MIMLYTFVRLHFRFTFFPSLFFKPPMFRKPGLSVVGLFQYCAFNEEGIEQRSALYNYTACGLLAKLPTRPAEIASFSLVNLLSPHFLYAVAAEAKKNKYKNTWDMPKAIARIKCLAYIDYARAPLFEHFVPHQCKGNLPERHVPLRRLSLVRVMQHCCGFFLPKPPIALQAITQRSARNRHVVADMARLSRTEETIWNCRAKANIPAQHFPPSE